MKKNKINKRRGYKGGEGAGAGVFGDFDVLVEEKEESDDVFVRVRYHGRNVLLRLNENIIR